ncbi:MAG: hypothetical protein WDZ35_00215 [Crocinitomicaceae bacterium]
MNYIVLSVIARNSYSILEFERIKERVNKALSLELVDTKTIFWDENGDFLFHPPIHKLDKGYWISALNNLLVNTNWEVVRGKV